MKAPGFNGGGTRTCEGHRGVTAGKGPFGRRCRTVPNDHGPRDRDSLEWSKRNAILSVREENPFGAQENSVRGRNMLAPALQSTRNAKPAMIRAKRSLGNDHLFTRRCPP